MSNADSEEVKVVVERGGVSVEKSFEPDDFPVPAIAFVIHSDREESTDIRIVDQVPDDVPAQDIGFHPKYGADFWSVEDEQIVFEREFEAGEEYTTVYGLRAKDTDDIERFLTEPTIEGVEGEASVSDIIGDEADDDGETGDEGEEPDTSLELDDPLDEDEQEEAAAEDGEETPAPAEASADDLDSAIASVDAEAEAESADDGSDDDIDVAVDAAVDAVDEDQEAHGNGTGEAVAVDDLAATLAAEIRAGDVADEDLETLSAALGPDVDELETGGEVPGHVEAKLDKLQADVDEVVAYTAALEEFLDDAGTADELLTLVEEFDDIHETVERLDGSVDAVESDIAAVDDRLDTVDDRLDAMTETTDALDDRVGSLETEMADLRSELETMEDELGEDLAGRVAEVEAELEEMEDDIETLDNLRQALAGN